MPYTELFTAAGLHVASLAVLTGLAILHSVSAGTGVSSTPLPGSWPETGLVPHQVVRRACRPAGPLGIEGPPATLEQPAAGAPPELTAEELSPEHAARLTRRSRQANCVSATPSSARAPPPPRPANAAGFITYNLFAAYLGTP